MLTQCKFILLSAACYWLAGLSTSFAAANFNITPKTGTTLPTSVTPGGNAFAFYTVTNLTRTTRNNYTVQGLPATVSQNTTHSTYPDICANPVTLASKASCTLVLDIRGEAKANFALCNGMNCTTASTPLNVSVNKTLPIIATGEFFDNTFLERPLLALSQDQGGSWHYPEPIYFSALPDPAAGGHLYGASCNGLHCISQGCFYDGFTNRPLLAMTRDGGNTWSYPVEIYNSALPSDFEEGNLNGASVSGNLLVTSGFYVTSGTSLPLIGVSQDGGVTWTYPANVYAPGNLPASFINGTFWAVSCNGTVCAASGYFYNGSDNMPWIAVSQNAGSSWTYPADVYTTSLPASFSHGRFYSASCTSSFCIATGRFDDFSTDLPLLAVSHNSGLTWNYPPEIYSTALPADFVEGTFKDASCSGNHCIAVGHFDDSFDTRPWLAVTQDNAFSWSYPAAIYSTALPTPFGSGHFNGGSCSGNLCIAAGAYEETGNNLGPPIPLIALSQDGGATWSYPAAVRDPALLPNPFIAGEFFSASCNANLCIAAGVFDNGSIDLPLLIISKDSGATWSYPQEIYSTALPSTFLIGLFDGGSAVSQLGLGARYLRKWGLNASLNQKLGEAQF